MIKENLSIIEIVDLCIKMTHLRLDSSCGYDRNFAKEWYESRYLTGKQIKYAMKPDTEIHHYEDGVVYRAFNTTDAIAEKLINEGHHASFLFAETGEEVPDPKQPAVLPVEPVTPPVDPVTPPVEPVEPVTPPVEPVMPPVTPINKPVEPVEPVTPKSAAEPRELKLDYRTKPSDFKK